MSGLKAPFDNDDVFAENHVLHDVTISRKAGDKGANKLVIKWADWNWFNYQVWWSGEDYPAAQRNANMLADADYLVAFTDGKCPSTKKLVAQAKKAGVVCRELKNPT